MWCNVVHTTRGGMRRTQRASRCACRIWFDAFEEEEEGPRTHRCNANVINRTRLCIYTHHTPTTKPQVRAGVFAEPNSVNCWIGLGKVAELDSAEPINVFRRPKSPASTPCIAGISNYFSRLISRYRASWSAKVRKPHIKMRIATSRDLERAERIFIIFPC